MFDHLQVQLAHAADERLAGFFVFAGVKGGVLPLHHLQHVGQLLSLGGRSGSMAMEITVSGKVIDSSRMGCGRAQGVAGHRMAKADQADDVAGLDQLDLLAVVGLDAPELGDVFLLVLARIVDAAVGL